MPRLKPRDRYVTTEGKRVDQEMVTRAAYHEAGHAAVALMLGYAVRHMALFEKVPRTKGGSAVVLTDVCYVDITPSRAPFATAAIALGSCVAVKAAGWEGPNLADRLDAEVALEHLKGDRKQLRRAREHAQRILHSSLGAALVQALAEALVAKSTLEYDDVREIAEAVSAAH